MLRFLPRATTLAPQAGRGLRKIVHGNLHHPPGVAHYAVRALSSRRGGGRRGGGQDSQSPPKNEVLVRLVLARSRGTADGTDVRLMVDRGREEPAEMSIVSLTEAIRKAGNLGVDLVGVALNNDPPVVKAVDFAKLLYEKSKTGGGGGGGGGRKGGGDKGGGASKPMKEYKFRAGIADADLRRKADGMVKYLNKGHAVQVTLTSNRRNLRADKDAVVTTLKRVQEIVGDAAVEGRGIRKNAIGNHATLLLQPSKKKR